MPSTYDILHDQYWDANTPKAGTRYERLVAFVLKALDSRRDVLHDIKLAGESSVRHQIDVTVSENGGTKRILVECKDFDVSSRKVGLDIIRDFSAVVDDVMPDEAIVITCVGFTSEAQKFAKHKGIKLAILREFTVEDASGRITTIQVVMNVCYASAPRVSMAFPSESEVGKLSQDMAAEGIAGAEISKWQPVFINHNGERTQITEYVEKMVHAYPTDAPGPVELDVPLHGATIEVESRGGVPLDRLKLEFDIIHNTHNFEVTSDKIARLLVEGFGDGDLIVYEEDLKRLSIDEDTGEVVD